MRPTLTVGTVDSLARAAGMFRENGSSVLPVLDGDGKLAGVLTDAGLAKGLAESQEPTDPVGDYLQKALTIEPYATAAEALRRTEDGLTRVVVDDTGRVVGLISAVDLWPRRRIPPRPATIGGMATPFGVYLTTGTLSYGARWWGLMATGATMFLMLTVGTAAAYFLPDASVPDEVIAFVPFALFLALLRLIPMSGIHAAEHQVVHAIEREEPLELATVKRMPRVHPRCGTNIAVGLSMFMTILFAFTNGVLKADDLELRLLPALILPVVFAPPLGSLVQRYITTRPATDAQLLAAIKVGEGLLERYAAARIAKPNPIQRIWNMGMLQVIAGATAMAAIIGAVKTLTHAPWLPDFR